MFFKAEDKPLEPEILPAQDPVVPISNERVEKLVRANNWSYSVREDGSIEAYWNDYRCGLHVSNTGPLLAVYGVCNKTVPAARLEELRDFIENMHNTKMLPRLYWTLQHDDETQLLLHADHVVHYEHGASNAQLGLHIYSALSIITLAFDDAVAQLGLAAA